MINALTNLINNIKKEIVISYKKYILIFLINFNEEKSSFNLNNIMINF